MSTGSQSELNRLIQMPRLNKPLTAPIPEDYWQAFLRADADYDGLFLIGVSSTGIFCRPSCKAKKPLQNNCHLFERVEEASAAGFRACKRCRPETLAGAHPRWVQLVIDALNAHPEHRLKDQDITELSVSPVRLRRYFKQKYQCTFQQWQRQQRVSLTRLEQTKGRSLSASIRGYQSDGGYRAALNQLIQHQKNTTLEPLYVQTLSTPIGDMLAGVVQDELVLLEFVVKQRHWRQLKVARQLFNTTIIERTHGLHQHVQKQLNEYFAGKRQAFDIAMNTPGTAFQQRVWQQLQRIPFGQTLSYQALAENMKMPEASRAVGTANGANRIAILVPCHRVINKSGNLGGYGGGLARKSTLLKLERGEKIYQ